MTATPGSSSGPVPSRPVVDPQAVRRSLGPLIDLVHAGVAITAGGHFIFVNRHLADMLGHGADELVEPGVAYEIVHPQDRDDVRQRVANRRVDSVDEVYDIRLLRQDGSTLECRACGRRVLFEGVPVDLVTFVDTTEVKQALRAADWKARMLTLTERLCATGSFEIDLDHGVCTLSKGMWELLGVPDGDAPLTRRQAMAWMPEDDARMVAAAWQEASDGRPFDLMHRVRRADGTQRMVHHRGIIMAGDNGRGRRGVAIVQDVTVQREAERRIHELANLDQVSGLPNRASLLERLGGIIGFAEPQADGVTEGAAGPPTDTLTLMKIAVPQVDRVHQTLGYVLSDALTVVLAERLAAAARKGEWLAHVGGGEFAVLLSSPPAAAAAALHDLVLRVQTALSEPVSLPTTEAFPVPVIGVARWSDGVSAARLLEAARSALQEELRSPGNGVRFYSPESNRSAVRRMAVEGALRHALARGELSLVYQPQVDLRTGTMTSVEALLRWTSATLGTVSPSEFIPVAEQTGLIREIGAWVLAGACAQAAAWRREGLPALRVHVNISAAELGQQGFAADLQALLATHGLGAASLGIEITESVLASDIDTAARTLAALRGMGVEIALDDFGTGYSNLSLLKSLPIDLIKIDRSYVHDVTASTTDVSVTRAVITLAHSLQMKVLAEGVETDGQLALLIANGCDVMQGHLFSPAVAPARIADMQRQGQCLPAHFVTRPPRERTLLLVDDEENIVASLKRLLRRSGYRIVTALSAAEGLLRLSEVEVDVIVSDQRMPGMTGVEFLRRAKELYPETVRIVLSGYTELQSITDAINEGSIYKFLTKPWEDDLLRANIDEAFRQKEMADENRRLDREVRTANLELATVNARLERALSSQREQISLAQGQGSGAREALFHVPVPLIGLDEEGMIAFVNAECATLLPELPLRMGCDAADVLTGDLRHLLSQRDGEATLLVLNGQRYRCVARSMAGPVSRGRLISLALQTDGLRAAGTPVS